MKYISFMVFVLLASCESANKELPAFSPNDYWANTDTLQGPIVRLYQDGDFICSGFVASKKYVMTAAHCKSSFRSSQFQVVGDKDATIKVTAKWVGTGNRSDYGILLGDFSQFNVAKATFKMDQYYNLMIMSPVPVFYACGYPKGGEATCIPVKLNRAEGFYAAAEGQVFPGMSGGPVFSPMTGEVIGVISAQYGNNILVTPLVEALQDMEIPHGQ